MIGQKYSALGQPVKEWIVRPEDRLPTWHRCNRRAQYDVVDANHRPDETYRWISTNPNPIFQPRALTPMHRHSLFG